MKPIRLELSGLNSYTEKQVVDFNKLTERGIFGIFGKTGSGKSTIVDAITIALYGNIARETDGYINSLCDKAVITYEFEIGNKNSKRRYVVDRIAERNNREIKITSSKLVEFYNDGGKTILADNIVDVNDKIAQIVGLTASDFMRTVALPQGKFNDFLKLTGSERRYMLERIFNLEKYGRDLIDKVKKRKAAQLDTLKDINSKLSQYDGVTEELYNNTIKEVNELKVLEKEKSRYLELAHESYSESKGIYEEQTKLEKNELRKKELDLKRNDIKYKTIQLENSINAEKVNPYIFGVQKLERKIEEDKTNTENLEKRLNILNQELIIAKNKSENAYNIKNEKLPKLSEEKSKLERAKILEEELILIDKELKSMKEKGANLNKEKHDLSIVKKDSESRKDVFVKNIKSIEVDIEKLNIDVDLKQKIFLAYDYEKEYKKLFEDKKLRESKLNKLIKEFDDINLKAKYIQRDKELISKKLENENNHLESLLKKCPGKNEDILSKTEYLSELKLKAEISKENEIKKNSVQNELNYVLEQKHNLEREINIANDKLESTKKNIGDLDKEIDKIKYLNLALNLRKELKDSMPCPVCGSRHHEDISFEKSNDKIEFASKKLEKIQKEESDIRQKLEILNSRNSENVVLEKIKSKEMEELKSKLGEIKSSELINKLDEENRKLEVLKNSVQRWQKDKIETEEKISKYKEEKNKIEKEEVKIIENTNSYKNLITEIKNHIEGLEINYKKIKEKYLGLKANIKISDLASKIGEINKNEKIIEELNTDHSKIIIQRDEIDESIRVYQINLHQIELELMKTEEVYSEKRRAREEKYSEVVAITKGELAQNLLNNLEDIISKIINQEEITKKKLEEQRIEYEKYVADKNNIEGRLKIETDQYKIQSQTLNQLLVDSKFESIYAVKRALLDPDHRKRLGEEISEYEEEQRVLNLKIKDLKEKLAGRRVRKEDFEELKNNIYNIKVEVGRILEEIGAKQNTIYILKDSLDKVKELSKQHMLVKHKVDLLEELDKTLQGNGFVEYVAADKLKYIAHDASKMLINITNSRYELEIDSNLNFIIKDNFNGGLRRKIDTLSGGETFLTSLSLALALSSQIKLKGKSPLEFFFLDEGFGALDKESLEIVIQALERLHSDNLSIGIISHIDEIKNRVPVKLIVMHDEDINGSKVNIEYS